MSEPLPDAVRARVVGLVADAIGRMEPQQLPPSLRRVASFAPSRRARLAATQIAGVVESDGAFRERVAVQVRAAVPDLARALDGSRGGARDGSGDGARDGSGNGAGDGSGHGAGHGSGDGSGRGSGHGEGDEAGAAAGHPCDPVDLAAVAYLLRPDGWTDLVADAATGGGAGGVGGATGRNGSRAGAGDAAPERAERLRRQLDAATDQLKDQRARHREQVADLKAQNADLRRKLGDARSRTRAAEADAVRSTSVAEDVRSTAAARSSAQDAEVRRLRSRAEQLERDLAALRRVGRVDRDTGTMRVRLLLDTLLETAQGLRRELALPASGGSPADAVEAMVAEHGTRASSGQGSLSSDDPALLDQLLALPRVHLVVDGYNVTKSAWPDLSLERQRDRLLGGLAPLAARSGAEVTVVFDAAGVTERPLVNRPRGVRVLYSAPGVIADDVIRDLVGAEPQGRPVVVVSSDAEVVRDVLRAGARSVGSPALSRLLSRA